MPKRRSFGDAPASKPLPPPPASSKPTLGSADNSNSSEAVIDDFRSVPVTVLSFNGILIATKLRLVATDMYKAVES